jgi:Tol biopolymer transport system component
MFAVSSLGALAFVAGPLSGPPESRLVWVTHDGRSTSAEPTSGAPTGRRGAARISPDGSRAIVTVTTATRQGLWTADWKRDAWTSCVDCGFGVGGAVWSPDGARLLFSMNDTLVAHTLDGSAPDKVLVQERGRTLTANNWRADGRIVYESSADQTNYEIKLLQPGEHAGRVLVPLGIGQGPEVSPDGRWLAYFAPQQGGPGEVMMQALPGPGSRTQISNGEGASPAWSADSRTLYYVGFAFPDLSSFPVFSAGISASGFTAGKPRELFRYPSLQVCVPSRCYDLSPDGQRFLFHEYTAPRVSLTRMDLVLNWTATLSKNQ